MFNWKYLGPVAIMVAAILWSIDALLRQTLYSLPAMVIVFAEHSLGFLVTLPWLIRSWTKIKAQKRSFWLSIFWVSIFGGLLGTFAYTKALGYIQYIHFSVVVLLQKLQPVFAILLARIILKERLHTRFYLWAMVALMGSYLVAFPNITPTLVDGGKNLLAGLFAVAAAFAWGSSTVMGKYGLRTVDVQIMTPLRLGTTALLSMLVLIVTLDLGQVFRIEASQWAYLMAIVLSSGTVALSIYYYGLQKVPASKATIFEMFWPISAVIIDWVVFDHTLTWSQLLGAAIMLLSIYQVTQRRDSVSPEITP